MNAYFRLRARLTHPGLLVGLCALLVFVLWGLVAARYHPLPQTDSLEQLLFAQDWRLAYAKHPPLPTWILRAVASVLGPSVGLTFVLGALCSALSLVVLYLWARRLVGAPRAALAALLCSLVVYYNGMTSFYNHNTVQLPFTIAAIALFYGAFVRRRWRDWIAFGVIAGLTLLVKLTALLVFASLALYVLYLMVRRHRLPASLWAQMIGAAALAVAIAIVPLYALYGGGNDAAGRYVSEAVVTSAGLPARLKTVWQFIGSAAGALLPAVLAYAAFNRRALPAHAGEPAAPLAPYLYIVGFAPLGLTLAFALVTGAHLLSPWATSLFTPFALWLVAASRWRSGATRCRLWRTALAALAFHALLLTILVFNHGHLPNLGRRYDHIPLPTPQLSKAVAQAWQQLSTAPLPAVVANIRVGAPMAIGFGGAPLVVDGNRTDFDRVVPPEQRRRCGVIFVRGPIDRNASLPPPLPPPGTPIDRFDAAALATAATGHFVKIDAPNVAGSTYTYMMAYQLPDPPDGRACAAQH